MDKVRFELQAPDLRPWREGNTGTEGVWHFDSGRPGRRVMVSALVHGNELCGAWAVLETLEASVRPRQGSLTLAFCNLDAFDTFNPNDTDRSRYADQDLNRLWGDMAWRRSASESGTAPYSREQARVLALLPWVEQADWLLDLHSMHADGPPLGLTGLCPHHIAFAQSLGAPEILVADAGHAAGARMRDHGRWRDAAETEAVSLLVECGWHGAESSRRVAHDMVHRFLTASGVVAPEDLPQRWQQTAAHARQRVLEVTHAVTVQSGVAPSFSQAWRTGDCVPKAGTVIGHDGAAAVVTPYDHCVLVMPALVHVQAGATLVRLAREA